jgi:hypothetical protein
LEPPEIFEIRNRVIYLISGESDIVEALINSMILFEARRVSS